MSRQLRSRNSVDTYGLSASSETLETIQIWLQGVQGVEEDDEKVVEDGIAERPGPQISVDSSHKENGNIDLVTMADVLGRNCPRLQNIHIASIRLSNAVVLALTTAKLRGVENAFSCPWV
ncbi:hypothetical protein C1H46_044650 [Malus baccata]|uniref:Uncharacterized protein n=1 Tax=Malus baccata TaxID=106549 RepID=A0A540K6H6_MALBA|nr:hypothetical protein C1H46_044650 [Malus baccata]